MKLAQKSLLRIKKMLKFDKERVSQPLLSLLKSDIYGVFDSYFEPSLEDISISYFVGKDGKYHFRLDIGAKRMKKPTYF